MIEKILIANAREAWTQACIYLEHILRGYVTLHYKKTFVSTLHNSVELLMKQRMLDLNDYRVARVTKVDSNGSPAKEYYSCEDLNLYFKKNGTKDKKGKTQFYSIEFNELRQLHKDLFRDYYNKFPNEVQTINKGITLLGNLRNEETHFYVNDIDFLNGSEFKELQMFMISFSKTLDFYGLLPTILDGVSPKIIPNKNVPSKSDYRLFLKANRDYQKIATFLNGKRIPGECEGINIVDYLWFQTGFNVKGLDCKYEEAIALMDGAVKCGLLRLKREKIGLSDGDHFFADVLNFS